VAAKNRSAARQIQHRKLDRGVDEYRGDQTALVAAGVAKAEWFPNGEKHWLASRVVQLGKGAKVIMRTILSGGFIVERYPTREKQVAAMRHRQTATLEARSIDRAKQELGNLPESASARRDRLKRIVMTTSGILLEECRSTRGGYSLSPDSLENVVEAVRAIADEVSHGEITFSTKARADEEASIRASAMPSSPDFERFMAAAIGTAPKSD
jgi:hypothetical protein